MTDRPAVSETAERLYETLGSGMTGGDAELGYPLLWFCHAICAPLARVDRYVRESENHEGWELAFDVDTAPRRALPYMGQFVGARLTPGLTEDDEREEIRHVRGWRRGTLKSVTEAVRATLTGTRTVTVTERDGSPYIVTVETIDVETPDPEATNRALVRALPAGILSNTTGQPFRATFADYDAFWDNFAQLNAGFANFAQLDAWMPN